MQSFLFNRFEPSIYVSTSGQFVQLSRTTAHSQQSPFLFQFYSKVWSNAMLSAYINKFTFQRILLHILHPPWNIFTANDFIIFSINALLIFFFHFSFSIQTKWAHTLALTYTENVKISRDRAVCSVLTTDSNRNYAFSYLWMNFGNANLQGMRFESFLNSSTLLSLTFYAINLMKWSSQMYIWFIFSFRLWQWNQKNKYKILIDEVVAWALNDGNYVWIC